MINFKHFKNTVKLFFKKPYMTEKTELYKAVENEDIKKVELLLATLPQEEINLVYDAELIDSHFTMVPVRTAFFEACHKGNEQIIELFLNSPKVDFSWMDSLKNTSLFEATQNAPLSIVEKMINSGKYDLNHKNKSGENIMFFLAKKMFHTNKHEKDSTEIFKSLIEKKVDYKKRNKNQHNVFDLAIKSRQADLVNFLLTTDIEKSNQQTPEVEQIFNAVWADMFNDSKLAISLVNHNFDYFGLNELIEHKMTDFFSPESFDAFSKQKQKLFDYIHIKKERESLDNMIETKPTLKEKIEDSRKTLELESADVKLTRRDKI